MEALTIVITDQRITVVGEVDIESSRSLTEAVVTVAADRTDEILLDLRAVTFIDSSGLHALTRLCAAVPTLRVVEVSPHVKRVLELAGLTTSVLGYHASSDHGRQ